jgi:hypothetical protein
MEVKSEELIDRKIYYIESYGPNGIIRKMKGIFRNDVKPLLRFDDVTYEPNKNNIKFGIIHYPERTAENKKKYYFKYFTHLNDDI